MATYQADGEAVRARFSTFLLGREDADISEIVAALGGRVLRRGDMASALDHLDRYTGYLILACDLDGGEPIDRAALARIDALAAARAWPLIVSSDVSNIDLVVALCGEAELIQLSEPTPDDWVAAFLEAELRAHRLDEGSVRESESARLARLNTEVARIAEVVARLSKRNAAPDPRRAQEAPLRFAPATTDLQVTAAQVRDVIRARRLRDRFFEGGLFEDPAWDMLLDLLAARLERGQVSVSSLCIAAAVPPTTALRWISKLTDAGLLEREADPFDKRRAYLHLSPAAATAMERYVAAVRDANLPFV